MERQIVYRYVSYLDEIFTSTQRRQRCESQAKNPLKKNEKIQRERSEQAKRDENCQPKQKLRLQKGFTVLRFASKEDSRQRAVPVNCASGEESEMITLHEPTKETPVIQPLPKRKEPLSLSADGQPAEDVKEEDEKPEELGSEPEAPVENVSGEPAESVPERPKTWASLTASCAPSAQSSSSPATNSQLLRPAQEVTLLENDEERKRKKRKKRREREKLKKRLKTETVTLLEERKRKKRKKRREREKLKKRLKTETCP